MAFLGSAVASKMLMSPISGRSGAGVLDAGVLITQCGRLWSSSARAVQLRGWPALSSLRRLVTGPGLGTPRRLPRCVVALRRIRGLVGRPEACGNAAVEGRVRLCSDRAG